MKVRQGFVSNSSTSSFVCDLCGNVVAERDLCISDAGMIQCQAGHVFCEGHDTHSRPALTQEEKKKVLLGQKWYKEDAQEEDADVNGLFEDFSNDEGIPSESCPFCCLELIEDKLLLQYLLMDVGLSREEMTSRIKTQYGTSAKLNEALKS